MSGAVREDLLRIKSDADHLIVPHPVYDYFPPPVSRIEAREKLGLKDSNIILFFGYIRADRYIPNEEVGLYFCASDLVVLPYLSATQSGIVKVAYHYNRPVIVTRVGGLPEAVPEGRCGYVVPPADPRALADAMLKFFSEKRGAAFEQNVREEKKKYTWERMAEAIESFIR